MGAAYAIHVEGLVKRYGETVALDGVDLWVPAGSVAGVLGPPGAGKTTLIRILAGLTSPDEGRVTIIGESRTVPAKGEPEKGGPGQGEPRQRKLRQGEPEKDEPRQRAPEMGRPAEGGPERDGPTAGGPEKGRPTADGPERGGPQVLLFDEPTAGLGPRARDERWEEIRRLVGDGATAVVTTRFPEEAVQLADRITALDRGRVVAAGRAGELRRRIGGQVLHVRATVAADGDAVGRILHELTGTVPDRDSGTGRLTVPAGDVMLVSALVRRLDAAGIPVDELGLRLPRLDEVLRSLR
ncbi:ATP-binding cassette domain-containing protein [Actinoplanes sp. CA-252034]|uniref:ATP-binding cassette domain-containing protein n=1 Tax=Actinoplanes sp. CA-252034 TaxID=3239906 RepID=UPI003D97644C